MTGAKEGLFIGKELLEYRQEPHTPDWIVQNVIKYIESIK